MLKANNFAEINEKNCSFAKRGKITLNKRVLFP